MAHAALGRRRAATTLIERHDPRSELARTATGDTGRRLVVAVAMSGGVDSSVAAALCAEAGFDVFGIMLRLWSEPGARKPNACCTLDAQADASEVAAALDIPFSVIDAEAVFERSVVAPFVADALRGDTPNPCLQCNRHVRFGFLLDQARALGADVLATGHYARVRRDDEGRFELWRGVDATRDQSYVLHVLDQTQLSRALFPLGGLVKSDVRAIARRMALPVAERPESSDLCWVGPDGVRGFLMRGLAERGTPPLPGPIVDRDGRELGRHQGLPLYTLGQRRGLGVATGEPVYVIGRDRDRNALVVGPAEQLLVNEVQVRAMHWIAGRPPDGQAGAGVRVEAQIRYKAPAASAEIRAASGAWAESADTAREVHTDDRHGTDRAREPKDARCAAVVVRFDAAQRAPTPGQALVAYRGARCLGGGPIA